MIRPAVEADAAAIASLWNWMIRDTLLTFTTVEKTHKEVASLIQAREGAFFVAANDKTIDGFATFGTFRPGPGYAGTVEHSIIVRTETRGKGLGRTLMACAERAACDAGLHVMIGAISSANPAAVEFHRTLGFEQVGLLREVGRKSGQWLDLILMQKTLKVDGS